MEKLLTTGDVAAHFCVSPRAVLRWIQAKRLKAHWLGHYVIEATALKNFKPPKRGRPKKGAKP